ncbi:MAG: lycopene cyclase [Polyangiales bacterium]
MTALDEARARVRDAAGDELVERLEHLDRSRASRPRDDRPPPAPDARAAVDCDVALVGSGLSTLYAVTLAARGLKVAVFDRARAAVAHREWNASGPELRRLVRAGITDDAGLEEMIVSRYDHGVCRWHGGGTYPVRDVLDHAIDASTLLTRARERARPWACASTTARRWWATAARGGRVALRFQGAEGVLDLVARAMVDARGASSPSATADLVCPTVGGVLTGLEEGDAPEQMNPRVGDILVTTEHVEEGRQHIWEGFPGRAGETTVYLFFYDRAERVGDGALMRLYARFFARLGRYKRGDARLERATFGMIPGWSRLTPAPRSPSPRVVLVGDAAARQSPLTYCGFGATLRSLDPASDAIVRVVEGADGRDAAVDDAAVHAATGALAHMIASPPRDPAALNRLLDAAFGTLHEMGQEPFAALLRDEMSARDIVRFLSQTSVKVPAVYPEVFRVLGARGVGRWGAGIARGLLG